MKYYIFLVGGREYPVSTQELSKLRDNPYRHLGFRKGVKAPWGNQYKKGDFVFPNFDDAINWIEVLEERGINPERPPNWRVVIDPNISPPIYGWFNDPDFIRFIKGDVGKAIGIMDELESRYSLPSGLEEVEKVSRLIDKEEVD